MEVEGEEADDDMEGADDIERMLRSEHPVLLTELTEVLFREADWLKAIAPRGRASKQKEMLDILKKLVEALGGLPSVSRRFITSPPAVEVSQTKSAVEMSRLFQQQRAALSAQTGSVSCWVGWVNVETVSMSCLQPVHHMFAVAVIQAQSLTKRTKNFCLASTFRTWKSRRRTHSWCG